MELSGTDQAMEVTVRVMKDGDEIDRIIRPVRMEGGMPVVTYRKNYGGLSMAAST